MNNSINPFDKGIWLIPFFIWVYISYVDFRILSVVHLIIVSFLTIFFKISSDKAAKKIQRIDRTAVKEILYGQKNFLLYSILLSITLVYSSASVLFIYINILRDFIGYSFIIVSVVSLIYASVSVSREFSPELFEYAKKVSNLKIKLVIDREKIKLLTLFSSLMVCLIFYLVFFWFLVWIW